MITYLKNGPIKEVEAEGKCEQRNLPSEYTQVEYLESSGTQYIDTGVYVSSDNIEIYLKTQLVGGLTGEQDIVSNFGTGVASSKYARCVIGYYQNSVFAYDRNGGATERNATVAPGNINGVLEIHAKYDHNNSTKTLTVNGISNAAPYEQSVSTDVYTLNLFNQKSGEATSFFVGKIYYCKIIIDGVLAFNGIPAKNSSDVIGMYDTVTGNFLTNAGTGDFVAGPDVVPTPDTPMDIVSNNGVLKVRHQSGLPLGYTLLDYVKSDRATIINIYAPTQDTEITTTFAPQNARSDLIANTATTDGVRYGFYYNTEQGWCYAIGKDMVMSGIKTGYGVGEWATVRMDRTGFYVNGTLIGSDVNPDNFTAAPTINFAHGVGTVKWRSFIVRKNGALVMNLIPAQNSGGVVGMYNLVSGQFFTSSNSYAFTAGDPVPDPVEIYTDGTVETINVHGKNLFDVDNNLLEGYYINNVDGVLKKSTDGSSSCFKDFLPSKPNVTYTMSRIASSVQTSMKMWAYDKDKNPISSVFNSTAGATVVTGTTPNGTAYIRCSFGSIPQYSQNIQLELGNTATTYEPYFNYGTATAEMLLKVGDYQDVQSIFDGVVTRNIGVKVLDGTEYVSKTTSAQAPLGYYFGVITNTDHKLSYVFGYCTNFTITLNTAGALSDNTFALGLNKKMWFATSKFTEAADFKQWLADQYAAGTPVIIVYPLAEPTTEYVTQQPLNLDNKDITASVIDGSLDNLVVNVVDYIPFVKKRYVTDDASNLTEVKKVYKGNQLVYSK